MLARVAGSHPRCLMGLCPASAPLPSVGFAPGQTFPLWVPCKLQTYIPEACSPRSKRISTPGSYKQGPNFPDSCFLLNATDYCHQEEQMECATLVNLERWQMWARTAVLEGKSRCCHHKWGRSIKQADITDTTHWPN